MTTIHAREKEKERTEVFRLPDGPWPKTDTQTCAGLMTCVFSSRIGKVLQKKKTECDENILSTTCSAYVCSSKAKESRGLKVPLVKMTFRMCSSTINEFMATPALKHQQLNFRTEKNWSFYAISSWLRTNAHLLPLVSWSKGCWRCNDRIALDQYAPSELVSIKQHPLVKLTAWPCSICSTLCVPVWTTSCRCQRMSPALCFEKTSRSQYLQRWSNFISPHDYLATWLPWEEQQLRWDNRPRYRLIRKLRSLWQTIRR